ncbi:hypothetical protein ES703_73889 [subsurface metagenome]
MVLNDDAPSFARSQGRADLVDGRSDRAKGIDQEAERLGRVYRVNDPDKPRESKREDGLRLVKKFGIAVCTRQGVRRRSGRSVPNTNSEICGYLILIKNREKLPRCKGCGKRNWVRGEEVIFQHDILEVVETVISALKGWQGRGKTIDRLPVAKMGEWARRAEGRLEEKAEVKSFHDHLPWNLPNFGG